MQLHFLKFDFAFHQGLNVESFIGGLPVEQDVQKLQSCHIAVGAPGRIKHLVELDAMKLDFVRLFVLDEADKLMDYTFQGDINQIYHKLPLKKQMIAVSATYPDELENFLSLYMHCPTFVSAKNETPLLLGLKQFAVVVKSNVNIVQQTKIRNKELNNVLSKVPFTQCLIFTNYQNLAESLSNILNKDGWGTTFISAAQSQTKRLDAVSALKNFNCRILISTDLTARGIDASNVDLVINYGVPHDAVTYLHRMGRAGRYGSKGNCITICNDSKELLEFKHILAVIGGSELSVDVLPCGDDFPKDLSSFDLNKCGKIFGKLCESDESRSQIDIKSFVFDSKSSNQNGSCKKRKTKKNASKNSGERVGNGFDLKIENAKNNLQSSRRIENNVNSDLANTETKKNVNKISIEKVGNGLDLEVENVKNILENSKKGENSVNSDLANVDLQTLLSSIGGVSTNNYKEPTTSKTSNCTDGGLQNVLESIRGGSNVDSREVSDDQDSKKRKREININTENSKKCDTNSIVNKNIALFNIAKLLTTDLKSPKDLQSNLDKTLASCVELCNVKNDATVKKIPVQSTDDLLKNIFEGKNIDTNEQSVYEDASNSEEYDDESALKNVFKNAYEYACTKSGKHWLQTFSKNQQDILEEKPPSEEEEEEEIEEEEECVSDEILRCDSAMEISESCYRESRITTPLDLPRSQRHFPSSSAYNPCETYEERARLPKDEECRDSSLGYFRHCFEECMNSLGEGAMCFDNVPAFEEWFSTWQSHVGLVRDYVQQNIYVSEMSKYQQRK